MSAAELQEVVAALAELVDLKDGPRDHVYENSKDDAWRRAREALSNLALAERNTDRPHQALEVFVADGFRFVRCSCGHNPVPHIWLDEHHDSSDGEAILTALVARQQMTDEIARAKARNEATPSHGSPTRPGGAS